jgi:hypothetical protein
MFSVAGFEPGTCVLEADAMSKPFSAVVYRSILRTGRTHFYCLINDISTLHKSRNEEISENCSPVNDSAYYFNVESFLRKLCQKPEAGSYIEHKTLS